MPVWSQVNIGGVPLKDYCPVCQRGCSQEKREDIFQQVKGAAYEIINRKGYTNFAISLALVRLVSSILRDENSVLTVSGLVDNCYGINDLCLSIPVIMNMNGILKHLSIKLDETETKMLQKSANTLKEIIRTLSI